MHIGIIGVGAIGGAVAARLLATRSQGELIALAAGSARAADTLRDHGLAVSERGERHTFPASAIADIGPVLTPRLAPYDLLLLCTRAEATQAALKAALPLLSPQGAVVCLQNGLPEAAVAALAGAERTLGAVINWSATSTDPGRVAITGRGDFLLGAAGPSAGATPSAGARSLAAQRLALARAVLGRAFPVRVTRNLAGARWSKLALNCAISTLGAVTGLSFGELGRSRQARKIALRVVAEVVAVARKRGVRLARVSGLHPAWLAARRPPDPLLPLRHALLFVAARARPRQRSGMLERLLAGRTSGQIDDLNGAVVRAARPLGVRVPLNERLLALVHAIERGEEKVGTHHLARLG
ncbi:MAG: ketopantoate reductase family protein [Myxococcales bacterium]